MRIRYFCPFAKPTGYARAAQDYLMSFLAARGAGDTLDITPFHECDTDDLEPRYRPLVSYAEIGLEDPTHVVVHAPPFHAHEFVTGDLAPKSGPDGVTVKKICMTTWETDRLPEAAAKNLYENFDLVIVPCKHNRDVFSRALSGVHEPGRTPPSIVVVPHAFDPDFWFAGKKSLPLYPDPPYVFYSILTWYARKGPIELLKAYLTAFTAKDNVVLKLAVSAYGPNEQADVAALMRRTCMTDLPKVEFITDRLSEGALRQLHYDSDCYVTLTRGEAWGLGAFEAAIVGNPVIACTYGGLADALADYPLLHSVPYMMTPVITPEAKITRQVSLNQKLTIEPAALTPAFGGLDASQNWAEPDIHTAKQMMRKAYDNRYQSTAYHRPMIERFSLTAVGKQLIEALRNA